MKGEVYNPYTIVQHPSAYPRKDAKRVPDSRILDMFRKQIKVDFLAIRLPLITGNAIMILIHFIKYSPTQLYIEVLECILLSLLEICLQIVILRKWEEYQLPFKMKDTKANYIFKQKRAPLQIKDLGT